MQLGQTLYGKRICLRSYTKSDLPFLTEMWFDEENGAYLSDPTRKYVDERYQNVLNHLENSTDGYYLVAQLSDTGAPIGSAGIFPTGDGVCDIGYCVHKRCWQQGYGSEIVQLLLDWAAAHGVHKIMAEVAKDNLPSNRLLQKFGFTAEKESKFGKYNMDVWFPSHIYAKILT